MLFSLIDQSNDTRITPDLLTRFAAAYTNQLKDFCQAWGLSETTVAVNATSSDYPIYLLKNSDVAQAAGYHATDPQGRAYARVFTEDFTVSGSSESIDVIGSHETLEMRLDLNASTWVQDPNGTLWALESCDAVEGRFYTDDATHIGLSDYLLPGYFGTGTGDMDRLKILSAPFTIDSENGYAICETASGEKQIMGKKFEELHAHKRAGGSRTLRRMKSRK